MNIIALVGRLTADPELKHTQSGIAVSRFTIAVDRAYTKQGEEKQADFINIVAWRNSAEFLCKYFSKGQRIGIQGSVRTGSYMDNNGIKRYTFEVYADRLEFVERKDREQDTATSESSNTPDEKQTEQPDFEDVPHDEDLPF